MLLPGSTVVIGDQGRIKQRGIKDSAPMICVIHNRLYEAQRGQFDGSMWIADDGESVDGGARPWRNSYSP